MCETRVLTKATESISRSRASFYLLRHSSNLLQKKTETIQKFLKRFFFCVRGNTWMYLEAMWHYMMIVSFKDKVIHS